MKIYHRVKVGITCINFDIIIGCKASVAHVFLMLFDSGLIRALGLCCNV